MGTYMYMQGICSVGKLCAYICRYNSSPALALIALFATD